MVDPAVIDAQRQRIVAIARTWMGTPFHDCQGVKGAGVDCAMLLKCVYEESGLVEPFVIAPYSPQWFLHRDEEVFMGIVKKFTREIAAEDAGPGDIALYRLGYCYAHGAIIVRWPEEIIHAHKQSGRVLATPAFTGDLGRLAVKFFSIW